MGRPRTCQIRESVDSLGRLVDFTRDQPQQKHAEFIHHLASHPAGTIKEAAAHADISARLGREYWNRYREGGLANLLGDQFWQRVRHLFVEVEDSDGAALSRCMNLITTIAGLNDVREAMRWSRAVGDAIEEFLPAVDYAVVTVKLGTNVIAGPYYDAYAYRLHEGLGDEAIETTCRVDPDRPRYEQVMEDAVASGKNLEEYGSHWGIDLCRRPVRADEEDRQIFLGCILLFRKQGRGPIPESVKNLMWRIQPYLEQVFSDYLIRRWIRQQEQATPASVVHRVCDRYDLSFREGHTLFMAFTGKNQEEIAKLLWISPRTVATHLSSVYRKTGVSGLTELIAREWMAVFYGE